MKKLLLLLFFATIVSVSFGQKLPFQGKLTSAGVPVTGARSFVFTISEAAWTETHANVSVLDGFYSVVLGSITPLPSGLFDTASEIQMGISVNGTALSPITLYAPLKTRQAQADTVKAKSFLAKDVDGKTKTEMKTIAASKSGNLNLRGANDSLKVVLSTVSQGYGGFVGVYDSLGFLGVRASTTTKGIGNVFTYDQNHKNTGWFGNASGTGGFMQLAGYDQAGVFSGATYSGFASWNKGLPYFVMEGSSESPFTTILEFGGVKNETLGSDVPYFNLNSSKRVIDSKGAILSMNVINDSEGSDPDGEAAEMFLWGSNTPNIQLGANLYQSSDLPHLSLYGSKDDGNGWFSTNVKLDTWTDGTRDAGSFLMYNTEDGGLGALTVDMTSNGNANGGQIALRSNSGQNLVELHDRGGNTGEARFFGNDTGLKAEVGSFGDNSGFMILYGANGNKNIQIDREFDNSNIGHINIMGTSGDSQGDPPLVSLGGEGFEGDTTGVIRLSSSTVGNALDLRAGGISLGENAYSDGIVMNYDPIGGPIFEMYSGGNPNIFMNGNNGDIAVTGAIAAQFLSSSDGTVQTSDGRLKTNVSSLENALINTRKMRGVSYQWIDKNRSQANQIGVIAQEVEAIYPEFVHTDEKGMKAVNYAQMVAVLIEAVKELDAKVTTLETQNRELKAQLGDASSKEDLNELKAEIEAIKTLLARPSSSAPQVGSISK